MNDLDLFARAEPVCGECDQPTLRVEQRWAFGDHGWYVSAAEHVCAEGHRTRVEPLDPKS